MTTITLENAYNSNDLTACEKRMNKVFEINNFKRCVSGSIKVLLHKSDMMNNNTYIKANITFEETLNIVNSVLQMYVNNSEHKESIEKCTLLEKLYPMIYRTPAINTALGIIYFAESMAYQFFYLAYFAGVSRRLIRQFIIYQTLLIIAHERRHNVQNFVAITSLMPVQEHEQQPCEIDANVAGHLFAMENYLQVTDLLN